MSIRSVQPYAEFHRDIGTDDLGRSPFPQTDAEGQAFDRQLTGDGGAAGTGRRPDERDLDGLLNAFYRERAARHVAAILGPANITRAQYGLWESRAVEPIGSTERLVYVGVDH